MAFNSFLFFAFFAVTGILFDIVKQEQRWILLLAASVIFIGFSAPKGLVFLLASCAVTYACTLGIDKVRQTGHENVQKKGLSGKKIGKLLIVTDIVVNLGILFATKYLNFFGEIFSHFSGKQYSAADIIVPLGISFYTFMMLGYAIDVYREEFRPQRNFGKMLLFASYFPQLVDGPISRYADIRGHLFNPPDIEYQRCRSGLLLFAWGLFKKLCVADNISVYVNMIYGNYQDYHGLLIFSGAVAYAVYLYADFSGCIDMARGVSRYFGIELKDNFRHPYFANSVEDFWRRWHITLTSWFKDYLFYPILRSECMASLGKKLRGGGYKKAYRIVPASIALFVVWIFTGLWHGARGTYILWGLYYGLLMIAANAAGVIWKRRRKKSAGSILITFLIVCFGYIIFNSPNIPAAFGMIRNLFTGPVLSLGSLADVGIQFYKQVGGEIYFGITVLSLLLFVAAEFLSYTGKTGKNINRWMASRPAVIKYAGSALIVFFLLLMMNRTSGDFTYMQF